MAHSTDIKRTDAERHPRYEIRELIGEGSMGLVYRAFDRRTLTDVALKTFRFPQPEPEEIYRLKREFRAFRDMSHGNLARLYDLEITERECFFTMELIEGVNFLRYVRGAEQGPLEPARYGRLAHVAAQLIAGLEALHRSGNVHRDLKPANVLVERGGRVVIVDFGLAGAIAGVLPSWSEAYVAGTIGYMAPEQATGTAPTPEADWYSVGVILFETLTGVLPVEGSIAEILQAKGRRTFPRPRDLAPSVPPALDAIVWDLLDPDPGRRPSPAQVLAALGHATAEADTTGREPRPSDAGPFVGRADELARLSDLAQTTLLRDQPAIAYVQGPSGIGKTALVQRFLARLRTEHRAVVLRGLCHPRESIAYNALDSIVDELSRFLVSLPDADFADLVPEWSAALLRLFPVLGRVPALKDAAGDTLAAEPGEIRRQGFRALRDLLTRLGGRWPLALWIDDAQWGDRDSALLLREIFRGPAVPRCLLVLSYRGAEEAESPLLAELRAAWNEPRHRQLRLEVGPLAPDEARSLIHSMLASGLEANERALRVIVQEAQGSPFFVGELVRYLASGDAGESRGRLSLSDVVRARLGAQSDPARDMLELVAVSRGPIPLDFLLRLGAHDSARRAIVHDLCAQCILRFETSRGDDQLDTYHDRIRDTVLATMDGRSRQQRHRQIADGLRATPAPDPQLLVEHYLGAGEDDLAAEFALRAAAEAHAALGFDRAAELYALALRLRRQHDPDRSIRIHLAEALASAGRSADAGRIYEEAAAAGDPSSPQTRSMLRGRAAEQYLYGGYLEQGMTVLRDVLRDIGMAVPATPAAARRAALTLRLRFMLRGTRIRLPDPASIQEDALMHLDTIWRASKGTAMLDHSLSDLLVVRHLLGALRVGEPSRVLRALGMEANIETSIGGRWLRRRSQRILETAAALARETADPYDAAWISGCRGTIAYFAAQWADCRAHCETAVDTFRTRCSGVDWEMNVNYTFGLLALAHLGRVRELSARLPRLLDDARARGDLYAQTVFRTGHTVLAQLAIDDPQQALEAADSTLSSFHSDHFVAQHYHHLLATTQAHLYAGDTPAAWARLVRAWPSLRDAGFLFLDCLNLQLRYLRATTALAMARRGGAPGWSQEALARTARDDARSIRRSRLPIAAPLAAAIDAGLATDRADTAAASAALAHAIEGFERADMALHHAAARVVRGRLEGGAHGRWEERAGFTWIEEEGIRNPEAMLRILVPCATAP